MRIQHSIGADIIMQLDDVIETTSPDAARMEEAMLRSVRCALDLDQANDPLINAWFSYRARSSYRVPREEREAQNAKPFRHHSRSIHLFHVVDVC